MDEKKLAEELVDQLMNRTEELGAEQNIENPDYEFRPVPTQVLYDTERRAMARARDLGLDGVHIHEMGGREMYMPGSTHADWLNALRDSETLQESLSGIDEDVTGVELSEKILDSEVVLEEDDDLDSVYSEWKNHVNMTKSELERWSNNPCSREASLDPEAVIKRNLRLLEKNKEDWTEEDIKDAKRTISFISRMRPNKPDEPRDGPHGCPSEWAISLLNWAYNPFDELPEVPEDDDLEDVDKITMRTAEKFFDAAKAQGERDEEQELSGGEVSVEVEPSVIHEVGNEEELQNSSDFYKNNWRRLFDNNLGEFSYQVLWRGLDRDQRDLTHDELLEEEGVNMVSDIRFTFDNVDSSGLTVFESRSEVDEGFVSEVVEHSDSRNPNERLEAVWKGWELKRFMDTGFGEPKLFLPGSDGATKDSWGKMFGFDSGTVELGVAHLNSVELFFNGDKLNGRAMVTRVPTEGEDSWVLSFPENQTPMAKQVSLEKKVSDLKDSNVEHRYLIWNDPESDEPMRTVNIKEFGSEEMREETVDVYDFDSLVDELWS